MAQSLPSDNIPSTPSMQEQVKRFLLENEGKELIEVNEQKTEVFINEFLSLQPDFKLQYNLLTQEVELNGRSLQRHENETLPVEQRLLVICEKDYRVIFKNKSSFKRHIGDFISSNYYHPVEKYLENLNNVSPVAIDNLASRYLGNDTKLANILLKKTLIAAVARALDPGCDVHSILVLYSPKQGIGKSRFLRTLATNPIWFSDTVPEIKRSSDFYAKLHQHWIIEIGEIDTKFRRKKEDEIKDFITSVRDDFRPAYGKGQLKCPRRFILTGSTNNGSFLSDQTGSRRYWIIKVNENIDIDTLREEIDGIWAAAVRAYNDGEQWWLTGEEEKMLEQSNASYTYEHPWYEPIEKYIERHQNDLYILPNNVAQIQSLDISSKEVAKPNSKPLKEIRTLLQQKFGYFQKKISKEQKKKLFERMKSNPDLKPRVKDVGDIPYSIWVNSDEFLS